MLVLLKNHLNYLKESIFKCFFKEYHRLLYFFFNFSQHIKIIRNLFRLKKELNYTEIKDVRIFFRLLEKLNQLKIEYLEILRIFLSMKNKESIINQ